MDPQAKLDIRPTVGDAQKLFEQAFKAASSPAQRPTLLPVCITLPSDLLNPSAIYLKLSAGYVNCQLPIPALIHPPPSHSPLCTLTHTC